MICNNCGTKFEDGAQFCPVCGKKAETSDSSYARNSDKNATYSLIFGILSLVISGILGIVFGALAIVKANAYKRDYEVLNGTALAGKILGIVGLIISILSMLAIVLYLFVFIGIFAASGSAMTEIIASGF